MVVGVVQGISEFLPISSSAHLLIVSHIYNGKEMPLELNVALHIGTLCAVLLYFQKDWFRLAGDCLNFLKGRGLNQNSKQLLFSLFVGSIPAGVVGLLFKDQIETYFHHAKSTALPLAVVGVVLWLVDLSMKQKRKLGSLSSFESFFIGCFQACALIPGVSRSGSTILGARLLRLTRDDAAKFSFMLGTPIMIAAAASHAKDISSSLTQPEFYLGMSVSFFVGLICIQFLLKFIKKNSFFYFAVYRVILAGLIYSFL